MTVPIWLARSTKQLEIAGIATARLDCLVLLEDILGMERASISAHPETELSAGQIAKLNKNITRRSQHEPLAYIRGKATFYGREFKVNSDVLVPRPETEGMIDLLKKLPGLPNQLQIADIGAGSGCLGITAALELPQSQVDLYDIDAQALKIAKQNAGHHGLKLRYVRQNLFENRSMHYDVLFANLPYVPDEYPINQAAAFEPHLALFGGADGLDLYRTLWQQIKNSKMPAQYIITESLPKQHTVMNTLAKKSGYALTATEDFAQVFSKF